MANQNWPPGAGEMAERIRTHHWAATSLGPVESWPTSLRVATRLLVNSRHPMFIWWGPEHVQIYNDAYRETMGPEKHPSALGLSGRETWAEIWDVIGPQIEQVMSGGPATWHEDQLVPVTRHGSLEAVWWTYSFSPIDDGAAPNGVGGVMVICRDVTEEHLAREAVAESEARHRLLIESWAQAVWETDPDGVVVADSPTWRAYTGQTLEAWLGYGWLDAIHPDDRAHAERQWREAVAARELVNAEFRLRSPDGGWRWTNVRAAPVLDDAGQIEKWAGINIDIDARKRAEAALRESEAGLARELTNTQQLQAVSSLLIEGENDNLLYGHILDAAMAIMRADFASLQRFDTAAGELVLLGHRNFHPDSAKAWQRISYNTGSPCGSALNDANRQFVTDCATYDPEGAEWFRLSGIGSCQSTPLTARDGRLIGMMSTHWRAAHTPTEDDYRSFDVLVRQTADAFERAHAEMALRDSEERFRALVTAGGNSIYRMSPDWRLMYQLDSDTLAVTAAPIEGWVKKYIPPEDLPAVQAAIGAAIRSKSLFELEHRVWAADGGIAWVISRAIPLLGSDGEIVEWFGAGTVVTERKQAEAALRESEERYRALFESMDEAYAVVEVLKDDAGGWADFRFIEVNPAFMVHTNMPYPVGQTASELLGTPNPRWTELYGQAIDTGETLRLEESETTLGITFDLNIFALDRSRNRVAVLFTNITDRKQAEAALRESEERQRLTIELVPALLWSASSDGQVSLNEGWSAYTGQSESDTQNYGWLDAIHPEDLPATRAAFEHAFATGEPIERQQRILKAGNGHRWHLVRHVPVRDVGGAITRWFGAAIDVGELRVLQDRQQVMVAELQHRTRNLIAVVRSIAQQTMAETGSTEAFRAQFNDRLSALSRVQGLLSRAGEERITIDQLVRMELDALGAQEVSDRIVLDGPEARLRNSVVQTLALAIHELATNARKYGSLATEAGTLKVTWNVHHADDSGRRLALEWLEECIDRRREEQSPATRGYGRELIERALPYALNANTSYQIDDRGVRCTIDLPLDKPSASRKRI